MKTELDMLIDTQMVREIALRARDFGRYQEACFYAKKKVSVEHFDLWFERNWQEIVNKVENERQSGST